MQVRWWALLVPLLAATCGNGDGPEETRVAGIPVLEGATSGPGTELGAGFTVAEGSVLVGTTFPAVDEPVPNPGFSALLLVTGSFQEVFDAYRRQAAELGVQVRPGNAETRQFCWEVSGAFTCGGSGNITSDVAGPTVSMTADRGPQRGDRPPVSHLLLGYEDAGPGEPGPPVTPRRWQPEPGVPPLPDGWPELAEEGEAYGPGKGQEPLRVPEGTELVAPPATPTPRCFGGSTVVLRTEEDPEVVVDRIVPDDAFSASRDRWSEDGGDFMEVYWTDGSSWILRSSTRPDEPTYLLLDHCAAD